LAAALRPGRRTPALLKINGSRFDLIRDQCALCRHFAVPPGRGLFPPDMTKQEFDGYVAAHPDQKAALYDPSR